MGTDTIHYLRLDSNSYYDYLYNEETNIITNRYELIFLFLKYYIYTHNLNPRYIIVFLSLTTYVFLYLGVRRFKVNSAIIALFYVMMSFFFLSFNISRQLAAMSIVFYATSFLNETDKKKYLFFLWVVIAALLHNSAIAFLLLFFVRRIVVKRRNALIFSAIVYFTSILFPITPLLFDLLQKVGSFYAFKYALSGGYALIEKGQLQLIATLINGVLLFWVFYETKRSKDAKTDFFDVLFLMSMIFYGLLFHGNLATYRFTMYFTLYQCLYLTYFFAQRKFTALPIFYLIILINYYYAVQFDDGEYYMQFDILNI